MNNLNLTNRTSKEIAELAEKQHQSILILVKAFLKDWAQEEHEAYLAKYHEAVLVKPYDKEERLRKWFEHGTELFMDSEIFDILTIHHDFEPLHFNVRVDTRHYHMTFIADREQLIIGRNLWQLLIGEFMPHQEYESWIKANIDLTEVKEGVDFWRHEIPELEDEIKCRQPLFKQETKVEYYLIFECANLFFWNTVDKPNTHTMTQWLELIRDTKPKSYHNEHAHLVVNKRLTE